MPNGIALVFLSIINIKEDEYMKDLKGSKTYDNLLIAFAGESQARNKYTFFASKARAEGYMQLAGLFEETAANEKEHASSGISILPVWELQRRIFLRCRGRAL